MKWFKKHDLSAAFVSEDGTIDNLLKSVEDSNAFGNHVFLQAYNQDDALLEQRLQELGYTVYLSKPYQYREPDKNTFTNLIQEIINQSLDAVIFTSKTQVQNLFHNTSDAKALTESFDNHVLAVAVGKVTASELTNNGVSNVWYPREPKMEAMVVKLRNYILYYSREKAGR
ncbi:hypothetical protein GCM10008983_20840 [Lentibacillus halophilus]|uniref:Tetrapyrrole biosynthesis uroporphyrinogen III synthase domain-containing protein n=2 Tax=Lentibacillus halophilus TaxID=295065 RepID=A0ABN0ZD07_9BACI